MTKQEFKEYNLKAIEEEIEEQEKRVRSEKEELSKLLRIKDKIASYNYTESDIRIANLKILN